MSATISVIVPIYNVENYLERCIKSIINQTFKDIEIILVNDGSDDNCRFICEKYREIDCRIKVIHKENGGLSDARNAGLDIATGKYVIFIDSDDFINEKMFEMLYKVAINNNSDVVQCRFQYFSEESEIENLKSDIEVETYDSNEAIRYMIDNKKFNVNCWNKIYLRSLFDDIKFPKGKIYEDEYITYKIFYKANKICYVNNKLYYYFNNSNGIMNSSNIIKRLDRIEALEERSKFFLEKGNIDLYEKSNSALFFALNKLYFLFARDGELRKSKDNIELLKNKIIYISKGLEDNKYLSEINLKFVKMINKNSFFINLYYILNYCLSIMYKLNNKFKKL